MVIEGRKFAKNQQVTKFVWQKSYAPTNAQVVVFIKLLINVLKMMTRMQGIAGLKFDSSCIIF